MSETKYLKLKEISERTGVGASTLLRYLNVPGVKEYLGIEGSPPKYPADAYPAYQFLADSHTSGTIRTANTLSRLQVRFGETPVFETALSVSQSSHEKQSEIPENGTEISELEFSLAGIRGYALPENAEALLIAAVRGAAEGRARALAETDRYLTAKDAAELLQVTERVLRRYHPPHLRHGNARSGDRWKRSLLLGD